MVKVTNVLNNPKAQISSALDSSERIPQFDSLRFIGAIAVMLFHYAQNAPLWAGRFPSIFLLGGQFAYLFFIMSGFLMQRKYKDSVGELFYFLWRRFRTFLVPVFLSKIIDIVLSAVITNMFSAKILDKYIATTDIPSVNLSNIVIDSSIIGLSWSEGVRFNGVTWSISSLLLCYFLFWLVETAASKYQEWIWIMLIVIGYNIWMYGTFPNHIWVGIGLTFFSMGCVLSGVDKILLQHRCYGELVNTLLLGG